MQLNKTKKIQAKQQQKNHLKRHLALKSLTFNYWGFMYP